MISMWLFGNGNGMGAPYFDQAFYWLVDTKNGRSDRSPGRFYTWVGGFGAQLSSFEWRCPSPGTRRRLAGVEFSVINAMRSRFGIMWQVSWAMPGKPSHGDIAALKSRLTDWRSDYASQEPTDGECAARGNGSRPNLLGASDDAGASRQGCNAGALHTAS